MRLIHNALCVTALGVGLLFLSGVSGQAAPGTASRHSVAGSAHRHKRRAPNSEEAEWKNRMESYFAAWSKTSDTFDIKPAARLYAEDSDMVIWDIMPLNGYLGFEAYKKAQKNAYDAFDRFRIASKNDLRVKRNGNAAWTTVTFHADGTYKDGTSLTMEGRLTDIWERRNGQWLIVHEHASVPVTDTSAH